MVLRPRRVIVLVTQSFQEDVLSMIARIRSAGIAVTVVGLAAGLTLSEHGVAIQPDCSLAQINIVNDQHVLIMPGDVECAKSLLSDPRVHQLMRDVTARGGWVAALHAAQSLVCASLEPLLEGRTGQYIPQDGAELSDFTQTLLHRI